jgi:hypothetical protein
MTVIQRRSPSVSPAKAAAAGPVAQAAPQAPQYRKPGGFSCPQAAHARLSEAPQCPQKRCAASYSSPQAGQGAVPATNQLPGGDVPGIPVDTAARRGPVARTGICPDSRERFRTPGVPDGGGYLRCLAA